MTGVISSFFTVFIFFSNFLLLVDVFVYSCMCVAAILA